MTCRQKTLQCNITNVTQKPILSQRISQFPSQSDNDISIIHCLKQLKTIPSAASTIFRDSNSSVAYTKVCPKHFWIEMCYIEDANTIRLFKYNSDIEYAGSLRKLIEFILGVWDKRLKIKCVRFWFIGVSVDIKKTWAYTTRIWKWRFNDLNVSFHLCHLSH